MVPSCQAVGHSTEIVSNLNIFPGEPSLLLATDEKMLTEEELEKRDAARRVAWIVFVAGGAPSVFAQNSLVWSKDRKKKAEAEAEKARLATKRRTRGRGALPKEAQAIIDGRFRAAYPQKDLDALWRVIKAAYGSEQAAMQAVKQNPTILNPAYTNPPGVVSRSKAALVEVLGEEGALKVMLKNPAVLQCGESLRVQPAGQIRSFASFRSALDSLPAVAPVTLLGTLGLLLLVVLGGKNGAWPTEADSLVQAASQLLAVGGISATLIGAVLQNVAETGSPARKK